MATEENQLKVGDLVVRNTVTKWFGGSLSVLREGDDGESYFFPGIPYRTQVVAVVLDTGGTNERCKIMTTSGLCGWVLKGAFVRA